MRAILDESLFTAAHIELLPLLECIALGYDERHLILCDPPFAPDGAEVINAWLQAREPMLRRELATILDQANEASITTNNKAATIRIIAGRDSDWQAKPHPRLTIRDALQLLREPLHILLEDAISDLAFLLRLAPERQRERLSNALAQGWAIADHAGGVDGIRRVFELLKDATPRRRIERLRHWIMFDHDSDERARHKANPKTDAILQALQAERPDDPWPLAAYRLERRAIENYLPTPSLRRWSSDDYIQRACDALESLRDNAHHAACQYNMKAGLRGDLFNAPKPLKDTLNSERDTLRADLERLGKLCLDEHCDPIFRGRPDTERAALVYGFTQNIADLYTRDDDPGFDEAFQAEYDRGGHALTREAILEQLLQRL
jgi:hypothetical protein